MESIKFNGITILSASKQLNTEISTLVKDLIYAISQLSANGLIESIENIFNETLEINNISNSNTKLNLSHLFGLMYTYQCTIQLTHISKLNVNNNNNDDDRKSNLNSNSNKQYDVDLNILDLFESSNRDNKFQICHEILSNIQYFKSKQSILLYYGELDIGNGKSTTNKSELVSIENLNENNNHHLMNKPYFNKFHFKRNMMKMAKANHCHSKSTINSICFNIHMMNHKIWKECKMLQNTNLSKHDPTSKTFSVLPKGNSKPRMNTSVSCPKQSSTSSKQSKPDKISCRSRSENDIKVSYMKLPKKDLGPYHDKKYHCFGRRHNLPKYSMEEISKHNTKDSCWIIVDNLVLDVTPFLPYHPASAKCIIKNGGKNCDLHFKFHSKTAQQLFWKFVIGRVESEGTECIIQ
mmetsp:Transcript_76203/g.68328  ORF Transcript_76203/g.68328 Transcript_76203/m.68328 type:complete len:408 (+) Transcript_76203:87-1310(+)